jgi:hypothetical protein
MIEVKNAEQVAGMDQKVFGPLSNLGHEQVLFCSDNETGLKAIIAVHPVIAANIGGLPELVIDGESGWHFPSGSREELAACLRQVSDAPDDEIRKIGNEALQRVRVNYSPRRYMHDIRKLYGRFGVLWN